MFRISFHPTADKELSRVPKEFRLRVGNYRIEFTLEEPNCIRITQVKHRQIGY